MRTTCLNGFLLSVALLALVACGQSESAINARSADRAVPAPPLIQKPGRYLIRGGAEILYIFEAPANAIGYQLGESTNGDFTSGGLISDGKSRWFLHSEGNGTVWAHDATLGVVRWTREEGQPWESVTLEADSVELVQAMPDIFFAQLPPDRKELWASFRTAAQ